MMTFDDLTKATALKAELDNWLEAQRRCGGSVFKDAVLRITDMAHGHPGLNPQQLQSSETVIQLSPKQLLPFIRAQIDRVNNELRILGVEA